MPNAKLYPVERHVQEAFAAGWKAAVDRYLSPPDGAAIPEPSVADMAWADYRRGLTPIICGARRESSIQGGITIECQRAPGHGGDHYSPAWSCFWAAEYGANPIAIAELNELSVSGAARDRKADEQAEYGR